LSSVVFKYADREKIESAVAAYAAQLREQYAEIERIIWFGSWVTGIPTPGSDVDLCLVVSSSEIPPHERVSKYLPLGFPVGVDLCIYTREEFERLRESSPGMYAAITAGTDI
jgi:predicted nucleotidyltransferase